MWCDLNVGSVGIRVFALAEMFCFPQHLNGMRISRKCLLGGTGAPNSLDKEVWGCRCTFIIVYTTTEITARIPQYPLLYTVCILIHFLPTSSFLHQLAKAFVVKEGHHMITTINIRVNRRAIDRKAI